MITLKTALIYGGIVTSTFMAINIFDYLKETTPNKLTPTLTPSPPSVPVVIKRHQSTVFEATGYAIGSPYNTITKLGQPVINRSFMTVGGIDIFTIAVDPKIIPLGSLVYIDSLGLALATDTGPAIQNTSIDICFTSMDEAMDWGRRDVNVYILRRGK